MSAPNHITVPRMLNENMHFLWLKGVEYHNVLLFLTDIWKKAVEALCIHYLKVINVKCIMHALQRSCETIQSLYSNGQFGANEKKVFVKSTVRTDLYKNKNITGNLPLPLAYTVACWRTWIFAVKYYAVNSDSVKWTNVDDNRCCLLYTSRCV